MKTRARLEILNFISAICVIKATKSGHIINSSKEYFFVGGIGETPPEIGSLIILQAAPFTKYYLSWLLNTKVENGDTHYLLESIEDGSTSWWYNVGVFAMSKEASDRYPQWRWTDEQFSFQDKWKKQVNKTALKPMPSVFNEDGSAVVRARIMFSQEESASRVVLNWKKVKISELKCIANELEKEAFKPKLK
jgi:hypothetical protein